MENGVFIGVKIDKTATDSICEFIDKVFESGAKHSMQPEVISDALDLLRMTVEPKKIELNNVTINGKSDAKEQC